MGAEYYFDYAEPERLAAVRYLSQNPGYQRLALQELNRQIFEATAGRYTGVDALTGDLKLNLNDRSLHFLTSFGQPLELLLAPEDGLFLPLPDPDGDEDYDDGCYYLVKRDLERVASALLQDGEVMNVANTTIGNQSLKELLQHDFGSSDGLPDYVHVVQRDIDQLATLVQRALAEGGAIILTAAA